jgi:hypothetical protein
MRGAMASGRKRKRSTRTSADYLASAKNLSTYVPSLKKFKHRKTLKKSEKATIRRRERQLKNIPFIIPVTKVQAKRLGRRKLFKPGVQAIQLHSVPDNAKIRISKSGDIEIGENGRRWIYWSIDKADTRRKSGMKRAAELAFEKKLPIEKVSALAERAFKKYNVQEVRLWAHRGMAGDSFETLNTFIRWVDQQWHMGRYMSIRRYADESIYSQPSDPATWINGIAILIETPEYTERRLAIEKEKNNAATTRKPKHKTKHKTK